MSEDKRIFDDFPKVSCNECEHYYTNACDGVSKDSQKICKTFLATRSVSIPSEIKSLRKKIDMVAIGSTLIGVAFIIHLILT